MFHLPAWHRASRQRLSCGLPTIADARLIPVADFAKRPKFSQVQFSPDGQQFGALQTIDGRANLTIGDLVAGKLTRITSFTTYDVRSYNWISNHRLVLSLYDSKKGLAEQRGGGLFAINKDGSEPKELAPTSENCVQEQDAADRSASCASFPDSEDEIIAGANERDIQTEDSIVSTRAPARKRC